MNKIPNNKAKQFIQCKSFGNLLAYSFKEDTLDLQFVLKMIILYSRSEFQKTRKEFISNMLTLFTSETKKQTFIKNTTMNEKDYQNDYIQCGIEKAYNLLMANNTHIKKKILKYNKTFTT